MRDLIFQIAGMIVLTLIGVSLVLGVAALLMDQLNNFVDKWKRAHERAIIKEIGNTLCNNSWWLSEYEDVHEFLMMYGKELSKTGNQYPDMNKLRDEWKNKIS